MYNRYTPTIAEKMRRCSGYCQRPAETLRDRERLKMGVRDLDRRSWTGRNSSRDQERLLVRTVTHACTHVCREDATLRRRLSETRRNCHRPGEVEDGCHRPQPTFVEG